MGLLFFLMWQLDYFHGVNFNVLIQIYGAANDKQAITPLIQAQKESLFQIIQGFTFLYGFIVAGFKPFIYMIWGVLFKQLSSKKVTDQIDLETIKV